MARSTKKKPTRKPYGKGPKNRIAYPYVVFQCEVGLKKKLDRKVLQLKKAGKDNASMSAFVENLVRKAV